MNSRKLVVAFFAPLFLALCTVKNAREHDRFASDSGLGFDSAILVGFDVAGVTVFFFIKTADRWRLLVCMAGGIAVIALVDLVDFLGIVQSYRSGAILPSVYSPEIILAKVCGGVLYGFCFGFLKPFHDVAMRPLMQNRRYDHDGGF
jgi:hypothetical protein